MGEIPQGSAKDGHETGQVRRSWYRRIGLPILMSLLAIGFVSVVRPFPPGENQASRQTRGRVLVTKASLRQLHSAVHQFHMDNDRWPTQAEGVSVLVKSPTGAIAWPPDGYLEVAEIPKDAWERDFIYELGPSTDRPFVITSLGADGVAGGEGYDADLLSTDFN